MRRGRIERRRFVERCGPARRGQRRIDRFRGLFPRGRRNIGSGLRAGRGHGGFPARQIGFRAGVRARDLGPATPARGRHGDGTAAFLVRLRYGRARAALLTRREFRPLLAGARRGGRDLGVFLLGCASAKERGEEAAEGAARRRHISAIAARLDLGARLFIAGERLAVRGQMHRLAVGEEARELVIGHARPGAHIADVEMHEGRAGGRIIADAAALHPHADFADVRHGHAGHGRVHRLAEHVLRIFRDRAGACAQHCVGLGRAIGGNDVDDLIAGAGAAIGLPHHIEEARIHVRRLVASPVAQEPVQLLQHAAVVLAIHQICRRNVLAGVRVVKINRARVAIGDRGLREARGENRKSRGDAAERNRETGFDLAQCAGARLRQKERFPVSFAAASQGRRRNAFIRPRPRGATIARNSASRAYKPRGDYSSAGAVSDALPASHSTRSGGQPSRFPRN